MSQGLYFEKKQKHVNLAEKYGAYYYRVEEPRVYLSNPDELYSYRVYIGRHRFPLSRGDSAIMIQAGAKTANWVAGNDTEVESHLMAVVIRGYQCGNKQASLDQKVNLPYINGCATRQIFPPERMGDPTLQQLTIPPYTSEQAHHIHSTARAVYVASGRGFSIVGQGSQTEETELVPGTVCILDPMSPHHFRTEDEFLTVFPVHVFSSPPPSIESNHPMFNGTRET